MKKILLIAILFVLCGNAISQIYTPVDPTIYAEFVNRLKARYALHPPEKDNLLTNTNDTTAQFFYNRVDSSFWGWSQARGFFKLGSGGAGGDGIVYTLQDNYDLTRVILYGDGVAVDSINLIKAAIYGQDPIVIVDTLPVAGTHSYLFGVRKSWFDSLYSGGVGASTLQQAYDGSIIAGDVPKIDVGSGGISIDGTGTGSLVVTTTGSSVSGITSFVVGSGNALQGITDNGYGVSAKSESGSAGYFETNNELASTIFLLSRTTTESTINPEIHIQRQTSGTPADGIGASIEFQIDGGTQTANTFGSRWRSVSGLIPEFFFTGQEGFTQVEWMRLDKDYMYLKADTVATRQYVRDNAGGGAGGGGEDLDATMAIGSTLTTNRTISLSGNVFGIGTSSFSAGETSLNTTDGKNISISDGDDQVLLQYDNTHKLQLQSTGTKVTGSIINNADTSTSPVNIVTIDPVTNEFKRAALPSGGGENLDATLALGAVLTDTRIVDINSNPFQIGSSDGSILVTWRPSLGQFDAATVGGYGFSISDNDNAATLSSANYSVSVTSEDIQLHGPTTVVENSLNVSKSTAGTVYSSTSNSVSSITSTANFDGTSQVDFSKVGIGVLSIKNTNITTDRALEWPDANGTVALTSDIKSSVYSEAFTGSTSTTITLSRTYIPGSIRVFKNGLRISNFTEATGTTITLGSSRLSGDTFLIDFNY